MRTYLELTIKHKDGRSGISTVWKELTAAVPCFPGMLVDDGALHRKEKRLRVRDVLLCTNDEPKLMVILEDYVVDGENTPAKAMDVFKSNGWGSPDEFE